MSEENLPPDPPIRRIVTAHDGRGKAVVFHDGPATNHKWSGGGTVSTLIWSSDQAPAEIRGTEDYGARIIATQPPANGSRFCVIDFPAGAPGRMHRTDTVDYVVCVNGEIDMEMDHGRSVHMKAGEVMVQQGTNHSWINNGTEVCRIAFVLIDGKPSADGSLFYKLEKAETKKRAARAAAVAGPIAATRTPPSQRASRPASARRSKAASTPLVLVKTAHA